jgi:hypothetical protein
MIDPPGGVVRRSNVPSETTLASRLRRDHTVAKDIYTCVSVLLKETPAFVVPALGEVLMATTAAQCIPNVIADVVASPGASKAIHQADEMLTAPGLVVGIATGLMGKPDQMFTNAALINSYVERGFVGAEHHHLNYDFFVKAISSLVSLSDALNDQHEQHEQSVNAPEAAHSDSDRDPASRDSPKDDGHQHSALPSAPDDSDNQTNSEQLVVVL